MSPLVRQPDGSLDELNDAGERVASYAPGSWDERRNPAASHNGTAPAPPPYWLNGAPMDPLAVPAEPLPTVPGFPYAHRGAGVVIVGPTGGGRSSLVEAGLYDAACAGLRCAYLGGEVTEGEFNARAADLASRRGDAVDEELRESSRAFGICRSQASSHTRGITLPSGRARLLSASTSSRRIRCRRSRQRSGWTSTSPTPSS